MTKPTSLPFTGDDEADRLLAEEPLALLIGFALDQQVTVQKAFSGPAGAQRRLGHLDAARIAAMDPASSTRSSASGRPCIASRARWPARSRRCARRSPSDYGERRRAGLARGARWRGPRAAPAGPARHRRDEGQDAHRGPRQALRRPAAGLRRRRADLADPRRRGLGRGARRLPGRQAGQEGGACAPRRTADAATGGRHQVRRALRHGQSIDITTTGRRTGLPRRIEIVFHNFDGRLYIIGHADGRSDPGVAAQPRGGSAFHVPPQGLDSRPIWRRRPGSSPTRRNDAPCSPRSSGSGPARTSRR